MSESIWDAFGVSANEVSENPFYIPRDEYPVNVEAEVKSWKEYGPVYFVINFTIMDGPYRGMSANRMFPKVPLTAADDKEYKAKNARTLTSLKKTLIELGLNAEQIGAFRFTPEFASAITGIKGTANIGPQKNNDQYSSVYEFKRGGSVSATPAASSVATEAVTVPAINVPGTSLPQAEAGAASGSVGSLDNLANLFPGMGG